MGNERADGEILFMSDSYIFSERKYNEKSCRKYIPDRSSENIGHQSIAHTGAPALKTWDISSGKNLSHAKS